MYAFRVPSHGSQKPQLHPFDFPQKLRPQHQSPPPPACAGFAHQALQQRDGGGGEGEGGGGEGEGGGGEGEGGGGEGGVDGGDGEGGGDGGGEGGGDGGGEGGEGEGEGGMKRISNNA